MYAAVSSSTLHGVFGAAITVEVHIGHGLPGFSVVGQPDEACRESRDRVRAALLSSGYEWPNRRITVNLSGDGEKKGGATADLAIAMGVLVAGEKLPPAAVEKLAFIGELGLDGSLRATVGLAPLAHAARAGDDIVVNPALFGRHGFRRQMGNAHRDLRRSAAARHRAVPAQLGEDFIGMLPQPRRRPIERQPVNIHQVLEHARKVAQNGFARHLRIVETYDPSLPPVLANQDQLIQVFLNSGLAYLLNRKLGVAHCVAGPSSLIGASNFFELAVAAAISLFGFESGAALATVVGVLIEVPVMLFVVRVVNASKNWYEKGASAG